MTPFISALSARPPVLQESTGTSDAMTLMPLIGELSFKVITIITMMFTAERSCASAN